LAFRPKTRDLLFVTDRGGDERYQLWLLPEGAAQPQALTADPRWVHQWGCFDAAGTRIAYAANDRDARHMDVHVHDLGDGARRTVLSGDGWRTPMRFSPDGAALLVQDNRRGMFDADLLVLDLETGATRPVLESSNAHIASARFIDKGAALMLVTDAGRAFHGVARLPLAGGAPEWLFAPEADVEAAALSKDERLLACAVNEGGYSRLVVVSREDGTVRTVGGLPRGRITTLLLAAQDTAAICAMTCFDRPSRVFRVDLASGAVTVLAEGAFPLAGTDTVQPETVAIESFDGQTVPAFVFEPRKPVPGRPALVIVHGGPESQYAAHWRSDVQHLVRHGWTVVAPNVRGSTGYGRAWQAGDDLDKRMDSVRDLKAVRDWLAARPGVDAGKLVVYGQSYGGFMVLAALTEYPDDWCAGAEFYGIADYNTLMATTGPWRRTLRAVEYGNPDTPEGAAMLADFSPMRKADRIRVPLFIAHGSDDPRVTPMESEMLYAALRGRGHPTVMLRIPYEGHGFARVQNRHTVFGALARFLTEVVAG
jgi:dipeptidyl aminopeptidase/acylaminoacyl peptidase